MLKEKEISLRTLESTDLDFLLNLENDRTLWKVSGTTKSFSEKEETGFSFFLRMGLPVFVLRFPTAESSYSAIGASVKN